MTTTIVINLDEDKLDLSANMDGDLYLYIQVSTIKSASAELSLTVI